MKNNKHIDADDPDGLLPDYQQHDQEQFERLVVDLREKRVRALFYPHSGCDWMPLYRLSHLADIFVYNDWTVTETEWEQAFRVIMNKQTPTGAGLERFQIASPDVYYSNLEAEIGVDKIGRRLAIMDDLPWQPIGPEAPLPPAWGRLVMLKRHVGTPRVIWLLFICGSPIHVYKRLFIDQKITPEAIFLPEPHEFAEGEVAAEAQQQAWQAFAGYGSQLSRLIQQNGAQLPVFMISNALGLNWPHRFKWQNIENFGACPTLAYVESLPCANWPDIQTAVEPGARRVVVTQRPLNPPAAKNVDAVVVNAGQYKRYRWPDHVTVIVGSAPEEGDNAVQEGPRIVLCPIAGLPLLEALNRIEQICAGRGLWRVAAQFFGFEDEAPALGAWRQQAGPIKELVLHVHDDGTFVSFGSVADQID